MKLERLFRICRIISYPFKGLFGCALVAILAFDPDKTVDEYVLTTYVVLLSTLLFTGLFAYALHDVTRVTKWIESFLVCLLAVIAETYAILFKQAPSCETLQNAYTIYYKCGRSLRITFETCVDLYDSYSREALSTR